jgi:putative addiction module killer protein
MLQILRTSEFDAWISSLRDKVGQKQILARLTRLSLCHWGDCKPVGQEVTELRIDSGPGYRVYCWKDGDKSSQAKDIAKAQGMVQLLKE